jgi:hypothetical protein
MSGCIFNGEALFKMPPRMRVKLRFDNGRHEVDIGDGSGGDFDPLKLKAFYAMPLVIEESHYLIGPNEFNQPLFEYHGVLLEQEFRNSLKTDEHL